MKSGQLIAEIGAVVQLVRMPACHAGGRGFESLPHRNKPPLTSVSGGFFFGGGKMQHVVY